MDGDWGLETGSPNPYEIFRSSFIIEIITPGESTVSGPISVQSLTLPLDDDSTLDLFTKVNTHSTETTRLTRQGCQLRPSWWREEGYRRRPSQFSTSLPSFRHLLKVRGLSLERWRSFGSSLGPLGMTSYVPRHICLLYLYYGVKTKKGCGHTPNCLTRDVSDHWENSPPYFLPSSFFGISKKNREWLKVSVPVYLS